MSKHTPGPWEISRLPPKILDDSASGYERDWVYISGSDHIGLAKAVWRLDGERSETCEANAHLIAAAPELLEALEDAFLFLLGVGVSGESPIMERLALVIRKAKEMQQ